MFVLTQEFLHAFLHASHKEETMLLFIFIGILLYQFQLSTIQKDLPLHKLL